jgi:hypothetical protein
MLRLLLGTALLLTSARSSWAQKVTIVKTPDGGIQPQAVVDADGTLHLIYFKGEAGAGDLYYVRRSAGQERFSKPIRVNSQPGSAIAAGSVRGGQLALGKSGRIHVAWNGSGRGEKDNENGVPMLYARLNDAANGFEDERNLMRDSAILDGGGTVAADGAGNVYVAWHGVKAGGERGEEHRKLWIARSTDQGKTFSVEEPAWTKPTGACACCSTRAFADSTGSAYLLYRSAEAEVNRDIYLLTSTDKGESFDGTVLHKWRVPG